MEAKGSQHTRALIFSALIFVAAAGTAAAEACHRETVVPAHYACSSSDSNSADFTSPCARFPDTTVLEEYPCPETWVSVSVPTHAGSSVNKPTLAGVCASAGLSPASKDGRICASGTLRPTFGTGWQTINYRYGTFGGGGGAGGSTVSTHVSRLNIPGVIGGVVRRSPIGGEREVCDSSNCYIMARACDAGRSSDCLNMRYVTVAIVNTTTSCTNGGSSSSAADAVVAFLCK